MLSEETSTCSESCSDKSSPVTQCTEMDPEFSASFIMIPSPMGQNGSSSILSNENSITAKKRAGRKTSEDTLILGSFRRAQGKKPPKKEYLRCQIIRGHKRLIRNIANNIIPRKTLNQIHTSKESFDAYDKLKQCYEKNKEVLQIVCKTEQGPKTDGQTKRQKMEEKDQDLSKSFNNSYCKSYFESNEVRESYQLYIDYLFSNDSPSELCKKFKFSCCQTMHTSECIDKWNILRYYVSNKMLVDLGVRPWEYRKVTLISEEPEVIQKPPQVRQIELEILELSKQLELTKPIEIDSQIANPHWFHPVLINRTIF
ncbi:unnamed protein product [Blepharisma stoltei]|uniref:Uncharacterized protein n=1 Tax=Blepharisma stoltei TaxID=1481888 RepID=A0AAU9IH17_9CILI|nr:unnamed protein product [Blepharisma stoltei]